MNYNGSFLFAADFVIGLVMSIYAALALLSGGSVQGVEIDFAMFMLGLLLLFNAKELYE